MRRVSLSVFLMLAVTATGHAQSVAGAWVGLASGQRISLALDSGAAGWRGKLLAPGFRADTIPIATVTVTRDSVVLRLPADLNGAVLRGVLSPDRVRLGGGIFVGTDSSGLFRLARAGSPAAAQLLAQIAPRSSGPRRVYLDPDSARLITSDIPRFWAVFDRVPADSLEDALQRDYIAPGTPGLKDFIPGRIVSAGDLAAQVQARRVRYAAARPITLRVDEAEPGIRAVYRELKRLYEETVYPDVYFIIGRFNSGGTASSNGLLIGAEMISDPANLPALVAHELIHFQQPPSGTRTLLVQSFREGAADFLGEMISGVPNRSNHLLYGLAHEAELWAEFRERMHGMDYSGWLYGKPPGERPADLGYFIGYRIAQSYYRNAADKRSAIRYIVRAAAPDSLLARSGYAPVGLGRDLAPGLQLVYASNDQEQPAWVVDSVTSRMALLPQADCARIHLRRGPDHAQADESRVCVARDTLFGWDPRRAAWLPRRPVGPGMTLTLPQANGDTVRYTTGIPTEEVISGRRLVVVPTTVLTVDSLGRPKRRLRERYAPGLVTATGGVFEVPDSGSVTGWRVEQGFELRAIRAPGGQQREPTTH